MSLLPARRSPRKRNLEMNMQTTRLQPDAMVSPGLFETVIGLMREASTLLHADPSAADRSLRTAAGILQDVIAPREPSSHTGLAPWQMRRVQQAIEERLDDHISNAYLAAEARLSLSHFARAFRSSFGVSPHKYVLARRVARARDLMCATEEPLAQIAAACGFFDQAHFSKIFRQFENATPKDWRRIVRDARQVADQRLLPFASA
ncbi:helix-turn-helix domain-containing protein [bacterium]|nr:helix-turn-helix domain-containing protein [bacterium]